MLQINQTTKQSQKTNNNNQRRMGNSIANQMAAAMAENQKRVQRELQDEMGQRQLRNMMIGQERMRRVMAAQAIAVARERMPWVGGFWAMITCGMVGAAVKNPHAVKIGVVPYSAFTLVAAYFWDLAYYTKVSFYKNKS